MRNAIILMLFAALPQLLAAQTASQNYILSRRPLNTSGTAAIETVTYVDGLGRPVETVQKGAAPDGGDIVSTKEYDGLDRLENVDYTRNGTSYKQFATYAYDSMGNIRRLSRKGRLDSGTIGFVDDLTYIYNGNQLTKVTDWARRSLTAKDAMHFIDGSDADVEYEYDANGNMTRDLNRNIVAIKYNSLDLPSAIAFNNKTLGAIKHTYLADGTRIRTDHISSSGSLRLNAYTEYRGNHVYENGLLSMTLFDGGFISYANGDASKPSFHYYIKDHLGSNRVVLADDGTVEQVNDHYPFGALMSNGWTNASAQRYKYIGKELDRTFGYDMYDNGARWNNSILGRWETMDKLAEKSCDVSPYAACKDNPLRYIDVNGKDPGDFFYTMDDAAIDFGMCYNAQSIREGREYGSSIYVLWDKNAGMGYSYSIANVGQSEYTVMPSIPSEYHKIVADVHTHGGYSLGKYWDNDFSGCHKGGYIMSPDELKKEKDLKYDIGQANKNKYPSYVVTPNGALKKYEPETGKISVVSVGMPSDENDPSRVNSCILRYIGKNFVNDNSIVKSKKK